MKRTICLAVLVVGATAALGRAEPPARSPASPGGAAFVSQSVPSDLQAEEIAPVSITMKNTGESAWDSSVFLFSLWIGFGESPVPLAEGERVEPGAAKTFSFSVVAPREPGVYPFQVQLAAKGGRIGSPSPKVMVVVKPSLTGNDAMPVSQEIPPRMAVDGWYPVRITMKNTGKTTWTAKGGYALHFGRPSEPVHENPSRMFLSPGDSIGPGKTKSFSFLFQAPRGERLQWRMVQAGKQYFGEPTKLVRVRRPALFGNLDAADCRAIAGWAADIEDYGQPQRVLLFADGVQFAVLTANGFRADLAEAHKGNGNNAFEVATPSFLLDGKTHSIGAFVVPPTKNGLTGSPRKLTCTKDRRRLPDAP